MEMRVTGVRDGVVDVALIGRLDTPGVAGIELNFTATLVPQAARAVVDMSRVEFIGSMGIRMLIGVARALAKKQGKLVLYQPQPLVQEVFITTSLAEIIPVRPDAAAAVAAALS
jgi:anti-sigma B factor antagonist